MSVQFGVFNFDEREVDEDALRRAKHLLAPFASDGTSVMRRKSFALLYGSFQIDLAGPSTQPHRGRDRNWVMWDGRLDNRDDVLAAARLPDVATDVEIVASAYERFGVEAFAQLVGDWAVSICGEEQREILLARDYIGARPLFYRADDRQIIWSTVLDPLVFLFGSTPKPSEAYLAGWLSLVPHSHLTPYDGVFSVPPSSFVRIRSGKTWVQRYWNFETVKPIRYRTDQEYEEHFRSVCRQAILRRANSTKPVLAELSGGMDSSSIVCVADSLIASGTCQTPRLDTVTYYDAAEPNWDELPYAQSVERKRGRAGHRIYVGPDSFDGTSPENGRFRIVPTSPYAWSVAADSFRRLVSQGGYRVVLSGIGGDEILGGVPTPIPELADLFAGLRVHRFVRQSILWAFAKRKPVVVLWATVLRQFLPRWMRFCGPPTSDLAWLTKGLAARNRHYVLAREPRTKLIGRSPSFQANLATVEHLRAQISCMHLESDPAYEWRYPLLDRDLLSFCFSVPREQIVRPRERRSLMRRALAGIVPQEILQRSRKAYASRGLVKVIQTEYTRLRGSGLLLSQELGIVDSRKLETAVVALQHGQDVPSVPLLRTLALEEWLRNLRNLQC